MAPLEALFGDDAAVLRDRDFQTLLLANVLPPLGAALLSPILDSLIEPFGTSAADIGLLISFFTAPAIVVIPVAGVLSDRYGRKPILVAALVLFGVTGSAIAFTTEYRVALALRALQGVAFGGITPVIITSLGDIYDGTAEATAQGIRFTGSGLTQTVFPLLSGALVAVAWQYPFLIYAMALPVAVVVAFAFEEPTVADGGRSSPVGDGGEGSDGGSVEGSRLRALLRLVRQRRVAALVVARGLPLTVWIGFVTYNSIVVVRFLGGTPTQAGGLVAVGSLVYAVVASQAGRVTARFDSRLYPLVAANACLGAGFALFLVAPSLPVAGVGIGVAGAGFGLALALYRSIITGLAGEALRGSLVSLAEASGRVVATATPILMGGVIAVATPRIGLAGAVQLAGLGAAAVGGVGGIVVLLVASRSPPVRHEE
ncbi:MAG: MFS transporter [Haloarculaceae archaeon]